MEEWLMSSVVFLIFSICSTSSDKLSVSESAKI